MSWQDLKLEEIYVHKKFVCSTSTSYTYWWVVYGATTESHQKKVYTEKIIQILKFSLLLFLRLFCMHQMHKGVWVSLRFEFNHLFRLILHHIQDE